MPLIADRTIPAPFAAAPSADDLPFLRAPAWREQWACAATGRLGSNLRGAVAKTCRDLCSTVYELYGLPQKVAANIAADLVDNHSYHFGEIKREAVEKDGQLVVPRDGKVIARHFSYRHPVIGQVIRKVFFQQHHQLGTLEPEKNKFNPMPVEVIALVATALACALEEWRTGVHLHASQKFEHDRFKPIYVMHMARLQEIVVESPVKSVRWRRILFTTCSSGLMNTPSSGLSASSGALTAAEKTDFSDLPI
ncbi:hypothetical protein AURDEDRAFT_159218 [Auricularia subglabra TFB-10046 SS5]|nr:hypothetical protein AURDEDRAFT_159218 [Auricularia subglabra TFB-10046 SS5]